MVMSFTPEPVITMRWNDRRGGGIMLPCCAIDLPLSPDYFLGIGSSRVALFESKSSILYPTLNYRRMCSGC